MTRPTTENGDNGATPALFGVLETAGEETGERFIHWVEGVIDGAVESKVGGGSGGGGPSDGISKKTLSKNSWLLALLVALFGSGGIYTNYLLTQQQTKDNETAIEAHGKLPMHDKAARRVDKIDSDLGDVKKEVGEIRVEQRTIVDGIEQLKQESQNREDRRIRDENADLKRELRRLRRGR